MRRILLVMFGFAVGFGLMGCHKKTAVVPAVDETRFVQVNRPTYSFKRFNDGAVTVVAKDTVALNQALDEVGCGKEYLCMIEPGGEHFNVYQRRLELPKKK